MPTFYSTMFLSHEAAAAAGGGSGGGWIRSPHGRPREHILYRQFQEDRSILWGKDAIAEVA